MKRRPLIALLIIIAVVLGGTYYIGRSSAKNEPAAAPAPAQPGSEQPAATQPKAETFDSAQYSLDDPKSLWVVVNKKRPLQPTDYVPASLVVPNVALRAGISSNENHVRTDVATALKVMFDAAAAEKITLNVQSAYRSHSFQTSLYNRYVQQQGQAVADTQSARPGFSEHQTGLAVDVGGINQPGCNVDTCFANTPEGAWVAAHAYNYGFIVRYPKGLNNVTGYVYEPWHLRFVGIPLASKMHGDNFATLEDFFKLPHAPAYN